MALGQPCHSLSVSKATLKDTGKLIIWIAYLQKMQENNIVCKFYGVPWIRAQMDMLRYPDNGEYVQFVLCSSFYSSNQV